MLSLALYGLLAAGANAGLVARTDTCYQVGGETCTNMYYGQKDSGKQVCISYSAGYLVVNYPSRDCKYSEGHVYIGETPPSTTAPGQYPYTTDNGYCKVSDDQLTITCNIPTDKVQCGKQYYIATHSADGCGETGWGYGPCITDTCNPWAMYWGPFTYDCTCPATSTSTSTSTSTKTSTSSTPTSTSTKTSTSTSTKTSTSSSTSTKTSTKTSSSTSTKTSTSTSTTSPATYCTSTSTYPPVTTSSKCSSTGYSYSTETGYTTTTYTSYTTHSYPTTSSGYCTYYTTPAPSMYTATCKAS